MKALSAAIKIAIFSSLVVASSAGYARAADVTFLCAFALQSAMQELIPEFEKASGNSVHVEYASIGAITERVRKGDEVDVGSVSSQQWERLQKENKIVSGPKAVLGKVGLGVFVKKGASRPDIGSVDSFKRAILNAHSIAIPDPNKGFPVGTYLIPLFERLGISGDIQQKLQFTGGGPAPMKLVAKGDAEIGFSFMNEIVASPDVDFVGPLPADIQNFTIYTVVIPASAKDAVAGMALIDFLTSPRAVSVFKLKHFDAE